MKITVQEVKENEDGSADAVINFDNEGLKYLLQYAVIDILTKWAEQYPIDPPDSEKKVKLDDAIRKRKTRSTKS